MRFLFVNIDWNGLVSKKSHKIHFALPPLDLMLLKDFAKRAGHEAKLLDGFVEPMTDLGALTKWADWVIVTTTPYVMWQCPNVDWAWIKASIGRFPSEKTILTGLHSSIFPLQTLQETGVFAIVRREPESVFRDFLEKKNWKDCAGVSYLESGVLRENSLGILPPMDELVLKDYDVDVSRYSYFLLGGRTGIFESSRGCPWKCTFCNQEMYSWKYRTKTPEVFADEVARGIRQTQMESAYFFDLEFTVSKKRTLEICEQLIKKDVPKKIRWACQTRADTVDEEVLEALKNAGCRLIHYGVESGNAEILKATNKKIDLPTIKKGVELTKKMKIQTACFFMFGLPGEKPEEFGNTLEFARELNPTYASFHFAIPFPGTILYETYLKEKNANFGDWPGPFFDGWPKSKVDKYISHAYKKFYLVPKKFEIQEFVFRLSNLADKLRHFRNVV